MINRRNLKTKKILSEKDRWKNRRYERALQIDSWIKIK